MNTNPLLFLTRTMWRFAEGNRSKVILYTLLFFASNGIWLMQPLAVAKALNMVQERGITADSLGTILLWLLLLPLLDAVFWLFHGPARVLETANAFYVRANYKRYLLSGVLHLPLDWHTEHHSGDTIDKVEKGTRALYDFTTNGFQVIGAIARFVGSVVALVLFHPGTLVVALVVVLVVLRLILFFDSRLVPQYHKLNHFENKISAKIYDALSNISTVVILRIEKLLEGDIDRAIRKPFALFRKNTRLNEWKWFTASTGAGILQFVVLGIFLWMGVRNGEVILVGTVFALFSYTNRINDVFFTFAHLYNDIVRQHTAVQNAAEISQDFVGEAQTASSRSLPIWETCHIHRLSFAYTESKERSLNVKDLEVQFSRGEKIAIIGESGSGKTTFLKLIRGLYTPQSGTVTLDATRLANGFLDMRDDIALIPQDPEIFATTIRENITFGMDVDSEQIERVMELARFAAVVKRLPRGLESSMVEKGVNLSGGEKQRLALARGLLASEQKSILLLDESTSSVDAHNELLIYENIFREYQDKTIIASIHRLHLLRMFDTIYLFQQGQIVARGNFEALLEQSTEFRSQWEKYSRSHRDWTRETAP